MGFVCAEGSCVSLRILLAWLWGVSLFTNAGPSEFGVCVLLIQIAFTLGVFTVPRFYVGLPVGVVI